MPRLILALSGQICTGKSTLANLFKDRLHFTNISTREFLFARSAEIAHERSALKGFADLLDDKTSGKWLCDDLIAATKGIPEDGLVVVDCIRSRCQVERLKEFYQISLIHLHLNCAISVISNRYVSRGSAAITEFETYARALQSNAEGEVPSLGAIADIKIETDSMTVDGVFERAVKEIADRLPTGLPHIANA